VSELPHDVAAEQCVIGALLMGASLADLQPLASALFYSPAHQLIFEAIASLASAGKPADPIAVGDELRRRGDLTRMGGAPYLHTCMQTVPAVVNGGYYAGIVRESAERRALILHADRIRQAAESPAEDLAGIRALAAAPPAPGGPATARGRKLILTRASDIEIEPVVWAWEDEGHGRIPAGSLGLFAGREGTGKSSFLIWLAARITTGELPGMLKGQPRSVIYVAVEDSWKHTIGPRLVAAGADCDLVYRAEVQVVEGETVSLSLPADNKLLEDAIAEHGVAMVALDPLMSAISDTLDTHVNRQVRQALDPLARLADRTGAVIAGIAHFNKSASTDASSLITASGAFKDVARFIFAFATDEQDGSKVITQTKNSLGQSDLPSLAYRLVSATVPTSTGDTNVGRLVLDGLSERSVQDILSVQLGGEPGEKTRADDYLRKALADGPRRSKDVEEEAQQAHGISKRTLDRARRDLSIPAVKGASGAWWISLPDHEGDLHEAAKADLPAKIAKDAKPDTVGNQANDAKAVSTGDVGTVGILDRPRGRHATGRETT
jgi:AAA domain/DnaB-like helicase N terminal domain